MNRLLFKLRCDFAQSKLHAKSICQDGFRHLSTQAYALFRQSTFTRAFTFISLALLTTTPVTAYAVPIADGQYTMFIEEFEEPPGPGGGIGIPADPNVESSFTFNALPNIASSQGMFDNATLVSGFGSGIAGDGFAGVLGMRVTGGDISFTSFSVDTIAGTAFGNLAQDVGTSGTSLFVGSSTDTVTTFNPLGRLAAIDGVPGLVGIRWDYAPFTTGSSTNLNGTVTGKPITNVGDINGDAIDDYTAIFVSAGVIGPEWGSFEGFNYIEVWNVLTRISPQ